MPRTRSPASFVHWCHWRHWHEERWRAPCRPTRRTFSHQLAVLVEVQPMAARPSRGQQQVRSGHRLQVHRRYRHRFQLVSSMALVLHLLRTPPTLRQWLRARRISGLANRCAAQGAKGFARCVPASMDGSGIAAPGAVMPAPVLGTVAPQTGWLPAAHAEEGRCDGGRIPGASNNNGTGRSFASSACSSCNLPVDGACDQAWRRRTAPTTTPPDARESTPHADRRPLGSLSLSVCGHTIA